VAARLQDMTKNLGCEVVLSDEVRNSAGVAADALPEQQVTIRGRAEPMLVRTVVSARALAALVEDESVVAA
jgi:adenylate cyclase